MLFADTLQLDHPRKTADGYLVARARASRSGIYEYAGSEVDPKGEHFKANDTVRVYRSEAEVFAQDSVASFLMKPVTNDHPTNPVTADNWREFAKGVVGKALRDGDFLAFDIVLMDKATIADVEGGKRELSNGYASMIEFTPGQTEDGQAYDAVQKQIRGNHVAVVDRGRAGPLCRIGDAASCERLPGADLIAILTDERTYNPGSGPHKNEPARRETSNSGGSHVATKTITFDGLPLEVTDAAEAAITKLQGQISTLTADKSKVEGDLAQVTTDKSAADAKIVTLEQQVKDAKLTPAQLRDAAKAYAAVVDTAKKLAPTLTIAADADETAIRKAVVNARLGDAAKDWSDEQIAVSFDTLAAQTADTNADPVRNALSGGLVPVGDAKAEFEASRAKQIAGLRDAHKAPVISAAA